MMMMVMCRALSSMYVVCVLCCLDVTNHSTLSLRNGFQGYIVMLYFCHFVCRTPPYEDYPYTPTSKYKKNLPDSLQYVI